MRDKYLIPGRVKAQREHTLDGLAAELLIAEQNRESDEEITREIGVQRGEHILDDGLIAVGHSLHHPEDERHLPGGASLWGGGRSKRCSLLLLYAYGTSDWVNSIYDNDAITWRIL